MRNMIDPDAELTPTQLAILEGVALGYANKEIAQIMGLSVNTVNNHISAIKERTKCQKKTELSLIYFYRKYHIPLKDIFMKNILPVFFICLFVAQIICGEEILRRSGRRSRRQDEIELDIIE